MLSLAAIFLKLYELVTNLFFLFSLLRSFSYFLIFQPEHKFNTCLKTHCPSFGPSVCLQLIPFYFLLLTLVKEKKRNSDNYFSFCIQVCVKRKIWFSGKKRKVEPSHTHKCKADWMVSQLPAVCAPPSSLYLPEWAGARGGVHVCLYVCVRPPPLWPLSWTRVLPARAVGVGGWTVATTGQFYSAPGWMLNLYLMYDISHKSSRHRRDPGVFRRLLFQCLSNCGIIRPSEKEKGERICVCDWGGGLVFEFCEMIALSLLWPSQTGSSLPLLALCYHDRRAVPNWKHLGGLEAAWNNHILCVA